jgi:type I restriction enzyme S subunit
MSSQSNDIPEGFKVTELGPLPKEWEVVPIGDLAFVTSGGSAPQGDHYFGGNNPFIRVQHIEQDTDRITGWNLITDQAVQDCGLRLFSKGTIVFPKSGASIYLEKRAVLPVDAYIVSHLCALTPKNEIVDGSFLFHVLRNIRLAELKADGYPTLNLSEIKVRMLPLPPLPEQKAIARVLSTIQRAVEAQDKIIAAARKLKKSLMRHLFTYGPVSVGEAEKVQLKETEIGPVPEQWKVVKLGEVTDKPEYGYTATASSEIIGPKYIRITDIQNGIVDWSSVPFCQCPSIEMDKYKLHSGDILFARIGATTGKTFLVEDCPPAVFASYLIRVRCKSSLLPAYLSQFTTTQNYWDQINALKGDRLKHGINTPNLKSLLIPFPSLPEQLEVASMLSAIDKKIAAEEKHKVSLQALFKTMLHLLMTGKVRVKEMEATAA